MNATPKFLLAGLYYALIQCGRLLTSAVNLYKDGDYATAVGLAALAREELGRSTYLRDQWKEVVQGKTVSVKTIREACQKHEMKQELGQLSVVLSHPGLGELLSVISRPLPECKEYQDAEQQIDDLIKRKRAHAPKARHNERMKAFYVEPNDRGTDWNKPWEKDNEEAKNFVQHACNDYSLRLRPYSDLSILRVTDKELADAFEVWEDRPSLPPWQSLIH